MILNGRNPLNNFKFDIANLFFGPIISFKSKDIGMLKLHMIYDLID